MPDHSISVENWQAWHLIDRFERGYCRAKCERSGYYIGYRRWQCRRRATVALFGERLCRPHAEQFRRMVTTAPARQEELSTDGGVR